MLEAEIGLPVALNQLLQAHTPMAEYPQTRSLADKPVLVIGCEGEMGRTIAHQYGFQKVYLPQDVMRWRRDFFPLSPAIPSSPDGAPVCFIGEDLSTADSPAGARYVRSRICSYPSIPR